MAIIKKNITLQSIVFTGAIEEASFISTSHQQVIEQKLSFYMTSR